MIVLRYLILTSNFNKIHLLVGLCLGPLGQLTALPRPLAGRAMPGSAGATYSTPQAPSWI